MEPEGSLPYSQLPATCLCPEPVQSSPYPHNSLPKIHLNIILPSPPGSTKWFISFRFSHQDPIHASSFAHTRYMPRQSHSSRFNHPHNSGWGAQIMKLLVMKFSPLPCYLVPLRLKILLNNLLSSTLSLCSPLNVRDQVPNPYKTKVKIIVLYILIFRSVFNTQNQTLNSVPTPQ
jgi:hypothetical protein